MGSSSWYFFYSREWWLDGKSTGSNPNSNSVEYNKDYTSLGNGTPGSSLAGGMAQQIELFDSSVFNLYNWINE